MSRSDSPAFTDALSADLASLGQSLGVGAFPNGHLFANVMDALNGLPPQSIAWADLKIAELARLYRSWAETRSGILILVAADMPLQMLEKWPSLAPLFIFHRDGYAREAALNLLSDAPASPFFLAALAWRLNDWAAPVRNAARRYAERVLPITAAQVIADTAPFLLDRWYHWGRWGVDDTTNLYESLGRSDVAIILARRFCENATGPLGKQLQYALRGPSLDQYLPSLFRDATQPSVRAVALKTLMRRRASWPIGYGREWIDRRFNLSRRVTLFAHRDIDLSFPVENLIREGIRDRSVVVRRIAVSALILHRASFPNIDEAVASIANDPNKTIRERATFLASKMAEENATGV